MHIFYMNKRYNNLVHTWFQNKTILTSRLSLVFSKQMRAFHSKVSCVFFCQNRISLPIISLLQVYVVQSSRMLVYSHLMLCAIGYHPPMEWHSSMSVFKLYKWYEIAQNFSYFTFAEGYIELHDISLSRGHLIISHLLTHWLQTNYFKLTVIKKTSIVQWQKWCCIFNVMKPVCINSDPKN